MPQVYPLPSAETIQQIQPKKRPLPVEPWVLAELSRLWQRMKTNIHDSIAVGTEEQPRNDQSKPASVRSRS
jgi:hypothetical protein